MSEEKSFPATPRKLRRAREEGKLLKSQILSAVPAVIAFYIWAKFMASAAWVELKILLECVLSGDGGLDAETLSNFSRYLLKFSLSYLILVALVCILVEVLQSGFTFLPRLIFPRVERLSPAAGLKRILEGIFNIKDHLLRLIYFSVSSGIILYFFLSSLAHPPVHLIGCLEPIFRAVMRSFALGTISFCAYGLFDYLAKRRKYIRELSMSAEEIRREQKDDEGDPLIRAMRKSMHEALLMQEMISRVRKAKVLVVERL